MYICVCMCVYICVWSVADHTDKQKTQRNTGSANSLILLHSLAEQDGGRVVRIMHTYAWCESLQKMNLVSLPSIYPKSQILQ